MFCLFRHCKCIFGVNAPTYSALLCKVEKKNSNNHKKDVFSIFLKRIAGRIESAKLLKETIHSHPPIRKMSHFQKLRM